MAHHSRWWVYNEGMLAGGFGGAASSSSTSLREIIPERYSVPVVDLFYGEYVEGPERQGVEVGEEIEKDPNETESDSEMVVEPKGVARVETKGMDTPIADSPLFVVSPIPVVPAESVSSFPLLPLLGECGEQDFCEYYICHE